MHINFRDRLGKRKNSDQISSFCAAKTTTKPATDLIKYRSAASRSTNSVRETKPNLPSPSIKQDNYPDGSQALTLEWQLKNIAAFHHVHSCDGEENLMGSLWVTPRVWFYSDSDVHIRALAKIIDRLVSKCQVSTQWRITVTYSDGDNPETIFCLEPQLSETEGILKPLRYDMAVIAKQIGFEYEAVSGGLNTGTA